MLWEPKSNLFRVGKNLQHPQVADSVFLIKNSGRVSEEDLRRRFPSGSIVACDFPVENIHQKSAPTIFGFQKDGIINIDHHAPVREMEQNISSGVLAVKYVRQYGPIKSVIPVVINHADCDSLLSALIMRGHLPPLKIFEDAVIAADHTGEPNDIADLLQILDPERDLAFSIRNLGKLLAREPLEPRARQLFELRKYHRQCVHSFCEQGNFSQEKGLVHLPSPKENISGELFVDYFRQDILLALTKSSSDGLLEVRLRLGRAAPAGFNIHSLRLREFDPAYDGRWNAGSNWRGGCARIALESYLEELKKRMSRALENLRPTLPERI